MGARQFCRLLTGNLLSRALRPCSPVHGTLHCGTVHLGGPCHETTGLTATYNLGQAAAAAGFHTYTVVWNTNPKQIRWYVDGKPYLTITMGMIGSSTWRSTFDHGFFILLNVAIGGRWPGNPDTTTLSGEPMLVDNVIVAKNSSASAGPHRTETSQRARCARLMTWLRGPGAVRLRRSRVRPWCRWKLPEARDRHADTLPGMFSKLDGPTQFPARLLPAPRHGPACARRPGLPRRPPASAAAARSAPAPALMSSPAAPSGYSILAITE